MTQKTVLSLFFILAFNANTYSMAILAKQAPQALGIRFAAQSLRSKHSLNYWKALATKLELEKILIEKENDDLLQYLGSLIKHTENVESALWKAQKRLELKQPKSDNKDIDPSLCPISKLKK